MQVPDEIAELFELDEAETLVAMARLCLLSQEQLRALLPISAALPMAAPNLPHIP